MIRDTLSDDGTTPSAPSADSPDIWVRTTDPSLDKEARPASYTVAGPHEIPSRSGLHWVYARIRNRGTEPSLDAWVRFYIALSDGAAFKHPDDWEPKNGLGNVNPSTWHRGIYLIGEVALPAIGPGQDMTVNIPWPAGLVPPELTPAGDPWSPHLLVEITHHDGPLTGMLIHENNNLAQRAIVFSAPLATPGVHGSGPGGPP
jgi:hypothetical protein